MRIIVNREDIITIFARNRGEDDNGFSTYEVTFWQREPEKAFSFISEEWQRSRGALEFNKFLIEQVQLYLNNQV